MEARLENVCPEIREGEIARAWTRGREKGNDGTIERHKDTECDKREREGEEIGEDRLKKGCCRGGRRGITGRGRG